MPNVRVYVIAYARRWRDAAQVTEMQGPAVSEDGAVGARVKSLREAMDLSLRDLVGAQRRQRADALAGRAR